MEFQFNGTGSVTPPNDLHEAARRTLGNEYSVFIDQYGEDFTPKDLCQFVETH